MMQKQGSQHTVLRNQGLVYYHATLVEAVLVMVFATFIFWFIFLVADLGIIKVMSYHAAYVMGRSHIVGFE
ncbi:MAG: hypothetical protein D6820_11855 [Lentisphaerae bacterium]|nr:MAG: hypothetical protein D6820_11855 [Lentisphaerota bacterium]